MKVLKKKNTISACNSLLKQMEQERETFESHWKDISEHIAPRRSRFDTEDFNKGGNRSNLIIDNTASNAAGIMRSGMMAGITSPARPWFKLSPDDPAKLDMPNVKKWLYEVEEIMRTTFIKSNLYNQLPYFYHDMATLGTGALYIEEDFNKTVNFCVFPTGSYYIANDDQMNVNVFARKFILTVAQVVQKFATIVDGVLVDGRLLHTAPGA